MVNTENLNQTKILIQKNLMTDEVFQCPYPIYEHLLEEHPVLYYEAGGFYIVSRMSDIKKILNDPIVYSSQVRDLLNLGPKLKKLALLTEDLLFADPPRHGRTRSMISQAFTMPRVNAMESQILENVERLFDKFINHGKCDAYTAIAMPLPIDIIAREFDHSPDRRQEFWNWSEAIAAAFDPAYSVEEREKYASSFVDLNAFLLTKRKEKMLSPTKDIISVISNARPIITLADGTSVEEEEPLSDDEFLTVSQLLIVGGNENTTASIMHMLRWLAVNPELYAKLRHEPDRIRNFIEEMLRLETPASGFIRRVTEDTEIAGVPLSKGSIVHLRWSAANRDPSHFECPEKLNLERRNSSTHLAFGTGTHACVGQMLARKEISCLLKVLFKRIEAFELDLDYNDRYRHSFFTRALTSLHITFDKVQSG